MQDWDPLLDHPNFPVSTHPLLLSLGIPRTCMWSAWDANAMVVAEAAVPGVHPVLLVLVRVRGDLGVQDLAL